MLFRSPKPVVYLPLEPEVCLIRIPGLESDDDSDSNDTLDDLYHFEETDLEDVSCEWFDPYKSADNDGWNEMADAEEEPESKPETKILTKSELDADIAKKGKVYRMLDFDQIQMIDTTCWDDWGDKLDHIAPNATPDNTWFTLEDAICDDTWHSAEIDHLTRAGRHFKPPHLAKDQPGPSKEPPAPAELPEEE